MIIKTNKQTKKKQNKTKQKKATPKKKTYAVRRSSDSGGNIRRIREEVEICSGFRKRFRKFLRNSESSNSGKIGEENLEREREREIERALRSL